MKRIITVMSMIAVSCGINAQVKAPKLSPVSKIEQKIGFTDLTIEYSRPSKSGRTVFGDLVPLNELWRTGANENTKFTNSENLIFGKDTLKPGTYAIFTKPMKAAWEVYFYNDVTNWGTPDKFEDAKVALKLTQAIETTIATTETFTINLKDLKVDGAKLCFEWENTCVCVPFTLATKAAVMASIEKTMAGPSANDYFDAATFYYREKKDLKQALAWATKATDMKPEAFWMLRVKAQLQAENGDKKGAIETAKKSMELAEKADYKNYVEMNKKSIEEWSKK